MTFAEHNRFMIQHGCLVCSHNKAAQLDIPDNLSFGMIRISTPGQSFQKLKSKPKLVLELFFEDEIVGLDIMTREQASQIVDMFEACQGLDLMVIHCWAGISRSSAISAAWSIFQNDLTLWQHIVNSEFFSINLHVLSLLLDEINKRNFNALLKDNLLQGATRVWGRTDDDRLDNWVNVTQERDAWELQYSL